MYRVVIVDDESMIRKGISNYIDWNSMGFEVAETFEDGSDAIEYINNNFVEIVLTDIKMAEVSGLDLAKYINENKPDIKVVLISGYKEFEYARKALKYGVEYYLLKPIKLQEVCEVFSKIKQDLDKKRHNENQLALKQKKFEETLPELREQFWISLMVGGYTKEKISESIRLLQIDIPIDTPCSILDVKWTVEEDADLLYYEKQNYYNLINNIFGGEIENIHSFPVYFSEDNLKIISIAGLNEDINSFQERLRVQIEEKCHTALYLLKLKFTVRVERTFESVAKIGACKYEFTTSEDEDRYSACDLNAEDYEHITQKHKLLMYIINDGDFEELDRVMDNIFHELRKLPLDQVKQLSIDMFSMITNKFVKMGINSWQAMNGKISYREVIKADNLMALKMTCKHMLRDIVIAVNRKQNVTSRNLIEKSIAYMKEHYAEDISIEILADKYFLNHTYFSRIFKQYVGTTFTDYMIELRMEKAKELLSAGRYKVYEVSQMVGYRSEKYFFRIFRQYAGCSPTEYFRGMSLNEEGKTKE